MAQSDTALDGLINALTVVRGVLDRRGNFAAAAHVEQALHILKHSMTALNVEAMPTGISIHNG